MMRPSEWIDISVSVSPGNIPIWPGSPEVSMASRLEHGRDGVQDSTLSMSLHTGTHIDAPRHFLEHGATVEQIPLTQLNGDCLVIDLRGRTHIGVQDLKNADIPEHATRLLLRTDNSAAWSAEFHEDFVALSTEAAAWVARSGVELIGIDYLSVQPFRGSDEVHKQLLRAGVTILEGINLAAVEPGAYELICLPLRLQYVEAAPARALLRPLHL